MVKRIVLRGGGDLASGVAWRLFRCGFEVLVLEVAQPLAVRRLVSFAEAIYTGEITIEAMRAKKCDQLTQAFDCLHQHILPVMVDPDAEVCEAFDPEIIVDARMMKKAPHIAPEWINKTIGLGPGFMPGRDCFAVVETIRGPFLGRVFWDCPAMADTGTPEMVQGHGRERVLRSPIAGTFHSNCQIGDWVQVQQPLAEISGQFVYAPFTGMVRGLLHDGVSVKAGEKVGDVDPRNEPQLCTLISDKALAIGGGVLEAILTPQEMRLTHYSAHQD